MYIKVVEILLQPNLTMPTEFISTLFLSQLNFSQKHQSFYSEHQKMICYGLVIRCKKHARLIFLQGEVYALIDKLFTAKREKLVHTGRAAFYILFRLLGVYIT